MEVAVVIAFMITTSLTVIHGCEDQSELCFQYVKFCNAASYKHWTQINCKKTCKFCGDTVANADCKDISGYEGSCKSYKARGFCAEVMYKTSMQYYCPKTCNLCAAPAGGWAEWGEWGVCGAPCGPGQQVRTRKCKGATCPGKKLEARDCMIKPCKSGCQDVSQYQRTCPHWKKMGYCDKPSPGDSGYKRLLNGYNFMVENCKATCNLCAGPPLPPTFPPFPPVNPCLNEDNGGCEQVCDKEGDGVKCSCNEGYTLKPDGKTCAKKQKPKKTKKCGENKEVFEIERIVGGVNAVAHRWEWQGGMHYFDEFVCGGSLVAPNLFLTAAHCVQRRLDETQMFIRFGDHDRYKNEDGQIDVKVKKIIIHEGWNTMTLSDDIALIQLAEDVKDTETIGPVCLPDSNINPDKSLTCYITGWGKTGIYDWEADILQEASLPIVPNDECGRKNVGRNKKSRILSTMICGGYKDPNVQISGCMGDSGGPYVCKENNNWYLQGVVSWGSNRCNATHRYTVFTRVNKYIDWINEQKKTLK